MNMAMITARMRYSPHSMKRYASPTVCMLLSEDVRRWNLAYLSLDWSKIRSGTPKDPHFCDLVNRSVNMSIATGISSLVNPAPDNEKVLGWLEMPPPQLVHKLKTMRHFDKLPLFKAYGQEWFNVLEKRAAEWREPHLEGYDFPLLSFGDANELLRRVSKI